MTLIMMTLRVCCRLFVLPPRRVLQNPHSLLLVDLVSERGDPNGVDRPIIHVVLGICMANLTATL